MPTATAYLYDARGKDLTLEVADIDVGRIGDHQLLWVHLQQRDADAIRTLAGQLSLNDVPVADLLNTAERPKIERFGDFYRLFIISAMVDDEGKLERMPIDFLVGRNVIVTISDGPVGYFDELLQRDRGETTIGALDAEGFLTTLLDLHIVSYFRAIESVESAVDQVDKRVLLRDLDERDFLKDMVRLRSHVSRLRRWFLPHRDIFYALARPDFLPLEDTDRRNFQLLNQHFENVVDMMSSARDSVFGLFDLYTTRASHRMNSAMRRLTFVALITGASSVLAGAMGMNFKQSFFDSPDGFWFAVLGMVLIAVGLTFIARWRRWI
ncbi:MAG: magnesium transporter CorA family protein [Thermomonas sp.]